MTPPVQEISETFGDGKITADEIRLMIEIGTLVGVGAVSAFLTWLWGKFKEWRRNRKKAKKHLQLFSMDQTNLSIYEKLLYLRIKTGASRSRIFLFHNGGEFLTGAPMQKFSCTHETSAKGMSNESEKLQNCFTSVFFDKIELVKKNSPDIYGVEHMKTDSKSKFFYKSTEVEYFAILPLYKNDLIVGFIEIEWNDDPIPSLVLDFSSIFTMVRSQIEFELMKDSEY